MDQDTAAFVLAGRAVAPAKAQALGTRFLNLPRTGALIDSGEAFTNTVVSRMNRCSVGGQTSNILVRNLMLAAGVPFMVRRLGDQNVRIDGVFEVGVGKLGIAEIELSDGAMLDAPRDVLDDCAVVCRRHNVKLGNVLPLIVGLWLPNARSEYWRVIRDIRSVLNVSISSLTVGALMLLLWEGRRLTAGHLRLLYADESEPSLVTAFEKVVGRRVDVPSAYHGFIEASK